MVAAARPTIRPFIRPLTASLRQTFLASPLWKSPSAKPLMAMARVWAPEFPPRMEVRFINAARAVISWICIENVDMIFVEIIAVKRFIISHGMRLLAL